MSAILERLFGLQDSTYKEFQSKLMPTIEPNCVIGVRTPDMRKLAKELQGSKEADEFLMILPHQYYEENNLHGMLLERIKDFNECITEVDRFLPYIDNWATCDLMAPKVFKKHFPELLEWIKVWITSEHTYTKRFAMGMLMKYYLDDEFQPEYLEMGAAVRSEEYYVNMMVAWYFATALAKQYEAALPYIENKKLAVWTHNKAIQKSVESYRITDEQKAYLKSLKIKKK